jgi:DNA-binding transcriptional regulator YhcF (GntR family)
MVTSLESLGITLDRRGDVPLGVQLAWSLRALIANGSLAPGQRLPGLRDLSEAVGVNANTVRAVYQRLESDGLVRSQQGSGTYVAPSLPRGKPVSAIATSAARAAQDSGIDPRDVAAALYVTEQPARPRTDRRAARRRELRGQIAALEQTLAELEAKYPQLAAPPEEARTAFEPRLLSVGELEAQRAALLRRLATLQVAIDDLASGSGPTADEDPPPSKAARRSARARVVPAGA